jgi:hypothetical protein
VAQENGETRAVLEAAKAGPLTLTDGRNPPPLSGVGTSLKASAVLVSDADTSTSLNLEEIRGHHLRQNQESTGTSAKSAAKGT